MHIKGKGGGGRERDHINCDYGLGLLLAVQWNLSNPDTLGIEESVLISEVYILISGVVMYMNRQGAWDSQMCPVY